MTELNQAEPKSQLQPPAAVDHASNRTWFGLLGLLPIITMALNSLVQDLAMSVAISGVVSATVIALLRGSK